MEKPYNQNFENHGRVVTGYHKVALSIFALNFFWAIYRLVRSFSSDSIYARLDSLLALLLARSCWRWPCSCCSSTPGSSLSRCRIASSAWR